MGGLYPMGVSTLQTVFNHLDWVSVRAFLGATDGSTSKLGLRRFNIVARTTLQEVFYRKTLGKHEQGARCKG